AGPRERCETRALAAKMATHASVATGCHVENAPVARAAIATRAMDKAPLRPRGHGRRYRCEGARLVSTLISAPPRNWFGNLCSGTPRCYSRHPPIRRPTGALAPHTP